MSISKAKVLNGCTLRHLTVYLPNWAPYPVGKGLCFMVWSYTINNLFEKNLCEAKQNPTNGKRRLKHEEKLCGRRYTRGKHSEKLVYETSVS